ncbi:hypothetical protein [Pseudomonas coleopterorum]|uniref:Uncharacterized protein n=1 Tax=Pseudomonas coleopterorum TaxID=1605838 RepID=A0ABR9C3K5_9PSED|nr:hypothetical protein [Pseudomonas coleopterorum]MBD8755984.1 hypothetical protein [Pseudomonas coleopterorum]MBD8771254.1 hypothetical protein [Pseudomonas coleopterorum]
MKYLLIILASYASVYLCVSPLLDARVQDIIEGLEMRRRAADIEVYIEQVIDALNRSKLEYALFGGTLLAVLICAGVWLLSR